MKKLITTLFLIMLALGVGIQEAQAKRLGGGKSLGMQRDTVTQRQATPPAGGTQQAAPAASGNVAGAAQPPKRNWLGPLAGLAAGIGLAALLSHFGFGGELASFLMLLLLVFAGIMVFRLIFRRSAPRPSQDQPLQYAGVGGPHMGPLPTAEPLAASPTNGTATAPQRFAPISPNLPPDFDAEGFIRVAKVQFVRMQAAHDAGNLEDIREFTTPEMFAEIKLDLDDRHGAPQHTEVVSLDAQVLEVSSDSKRHIASVRFHGSIREEQNGPAEAFDEVWNLVKPLSGGGWVLAGVQQLN